MRFQKRNVVHAVPIFMVFVFFSGCALQKRNIINDAYLKNTLNNVFKTMYSDNLKAIHHVTLTLLKKNYVLNGYLLVDRKKRAISLIAQNDLGGTIFEIFYIKDEKKEINVKIDMLKKTWLEKSVLRDLINLYLTEPLLAPMLAYDKDNNLMLYQNDKKMTREHIFRKNDAKEMSYQLIETRYLKKRNCYYSIRFYYNNKNKWDSSDYIFVKNEEMHYSLKISVKYLG